MLEGLELLSNIDDLIRLLDDVEKKHLPFAAARTLTRLATMGQGEVRRELPDRFNIRKPHVAKGIRIEPARFRRGVRIGELESRVFTLDWYMRDQEEGGTRGLTLRGKRRAVPTLKMRKGGTIKGLPAKRAGTLLKQSDRARGRKRLKNGKRRKPLPFKIERPDGSALIYRRNPYFGGVLSLLYVLAPDTRIEARMGMGETTGEVFTDHFSPVMLDSMQAALAGNRVKGELKPIRNRALDFVSENGGFDGPVVSSMMR